MLIRPIDALLPRLGRQFGGKATGLAALVRAGFPVPAAYALAREAADEAYARVLPTGRLALLGEGPALAAQSAALREKIMGLSLPPGLERELARTLGLLRAASAESVAVRSSSTVEDHALASAAGLFTTTLNVRDEEALFMAVKRAWASLLSPAALSYAATVGTMDEAGMAVVIQAMVPADAAGVLFTENPLTGDPDELVIHASFGLGTQVDGQSTPDTFRVDKRTGFVRDRVIAHKAKRVTLSKAGGVVEQPVPAWEADVQALDEHVLSQLTVLGRRIEEHFGEARGVEFAVAGDTVYVLQSRSVSARPTLAPQQQGRSGGLRARLFGGPSKPKPSRGSGHGDPSTLLWSNLNVGEVLPGVATPLTWSALAGFAEQGFREALAALGCKVPKGARLLGSFRGRIYLNLSELEGIAAQVPGLRSSHLLLAGNAAKEWARAEQDVPAAHDAKHGNLLIRLPGVASRLASAHLGFEQRYARFESAFAFERARLDRLDLRILPGAALDETLSDVERLLGNTGALLAQAYGGLVAALLPLRSALALLAPGEAPAVLSALLSAIEDVESASPGRELLSVVRAFGDDPAAREKLIAGVSSMIDLPPGPAFAALERLLDRYGHRAVREVELAEPRWRESPRFLLDAVRMQLLHEAHGHDSVVLLERRIEALREQADAALRKLPAPTRPALRGVLSVVRRYVRRREELRSQIAHVLGMFRRVALDASRRMLVREPELVEGPAFMLTASELHAFLRGELRSVRALTVLRRRQYARDLSLPDPPDTFVGYPPPPALNVAPERADRLNGLAASAGQVEGRVRVLRSPDATMEPGEILVVPAADIGWTPLFVTAGGLVSELGGPLSHACVAAREYGLPAVVSVRSATRALKTGDRVRLDGTSGTVELIGHA